MIQTICDFLTSDDKQKVLVEQFLTISLAVIGIAFTLLTVLQSFIESKKSSIQSWTKAIKNVQDKDKSPMIYEREQVRLANEYVLRQKRLVRKIQKKKGKINDRYNYSFNSINNSLLLLRWLIITHLALPPSLLLNPSVIHPYGKCPSSYNICRRL